MPDFDPTDYFSRVGVTEAEDPSQPFDPKNYFGESPESSEIEAKPFDPSEYFSAGSDPASTDVAEFDPASYFGGEQSTQDEDKKSLKPFDPKDYFQE